MTEATSLLDQIDARVRCEVPWETMTGDDRVRHCGQCKLNVYNLSQMSREGAEELIAGREGRLCVQFRRRNDGTVVTRDCQSVLRSLRRRARWIAATFAAVLGISTVGLASDAEETGGLEAWDTWQVQPFRTIAKVLPAAWIPAPPEIELRGEVYIPEPPPNPVPPGEDQLPPTQK